MRHNRRTFFVLRLLACAYVTTLSLSPFLLRAQTDREELVQMAMKEAEQGGYNGVTEKMLGRLGDASAVAITKLLADKPIAATDIPAILIIVRLSYNFPDGIEESADRKPRTTLFLLNSLSHMTNDPKNVEKIADTAAFVRAQYTTYAKAHSTK